jgi:hypothetical protein
MYNSQKTLGLRSMVDLLMMCRKIITACCKNFAKFKDESSLRYVSYYNTNLHGKQCKHPLRSKCLINCNNISITVQINAICTRIRIATFFKLVHKLKLSLNFNDINTRSRNIKQVMVTFRCHESER